MLDNRNKVLARVQAVQTVETPTGPVWRWQIELTDPAGNSATVYHATGTEPSKGSTLAELLGAIGHEGGAPVKPKELIGRACVARASSSYDAIARTHRGEVTKFLAPAAEDRGTWPGELVGVK